MDLSIVYIHRYDPKYLETSIRQAKRVFQGHRIILLGDATNQHLAQDVGIEHYFLEDYRHPHVLLNYYHRSPNEEAYEKLCFERYYILENFIKEKGIPRVMMTDSDIFYFENFIELIHDQLQREGPLYGTVAFQPNKAIVPFLWDVEMISHFTAYLDTFFSLGARKSIDALCNNGVIGHIADYYVAGLYSQGIFTEELPLLPNGILPKCPMNVNAINLWDWSLKNNRLFCRNIYYSAHKKTLQRVSASDFLLKETGETISFLHFQGPSKHCIHKIDHFVNHSQELTYEVDVLP